MYPPLANKPHKGSTGTAALIHSLVHSFTLTSAPKDVDSQCPSQFTLGERHHVPTEPETGWIPEPVCTVLANIKSLVLYQQGLDQQTVQSEVYRYIDYATPAVWK